jgi:threonylcarbamoyladenosine tRNA methylthiotransferase MtaB
LTGVDITGYGSDLPAKPTLGILIKRILNLCPKLERLRLSSIDVAEIDNDIKDLIMYESRFMPYFHISLQSGDNMILKRMKRRHKREDVINFCEFVNKYRNNAGFGADIISGFPTETEEMFENSVKLIHECNIAFVHAFTFSPREGTPAAVMPQVDKKIAKDRTKLLIQAGKEERLNLLNNMIGKEYNVLVEQNGVGRAENFAEFDVADYKQNTVVSIVGKRVCKKKYRIIL